jgi:hypothetical protein
MIEDPLQLGVNSIGHLLGDHLPGCDLSLDPNSSMIVAQVKKAECLLLIFSLQLSYPLDLELI